MCDREKMAGAGYWISPRNINRNVHVLSFEAKTRDYAKKNELPLMVNYPPFTYCTETSKINAVSFFGSKMTFLLIALCFPCKLDMYMFLIGN